MSYSIVVNDTFLNQLLGLPRNISNKVSGKLKVIQGDPICAQGDARKLQHASYENLYRVRVSDYRLIYSFKSNWVTCLSIGHRSDIYKHLNISPPSVPGPSDPIAPLTPTPQTRLLSEEMLKNCLVPPEYIATLLAVENENDLLYLDIPSKILARILDIIYPPSLEKISQQPEKLIPKLEDLDLLFQGNIMDFLLKLDEEQERICNYKLGEPVLLSGGPGTGKTVLAIYRVQRLLKQGCKSVLFTAHSSALTAYAGKLLEQLLGDAPYKLGVEVNTVDAIINSYFQGYFNSRKIPSYADFETYVSQAFEYVLNLPKTGAKKLEWKSSGSRLKNKGFDYISREILDTIESCGIRKEADYMKFNSSKKIQLQDKPFIWGVYTKTKEMINSDGLMTEDEPRFEALKRAETDLQIKKYDAIVIDEAQDLSPVSFEFLLSKVNNYKNIFVTADSSQAIYKRGFNWKQVHKHLNGHILTLNFNYRNTEEIAAACRNILQAEDNYQPSLRTSQLPKIVFCQDETDEIAKIKKFFIDSAREYKIPLMGAALICPTIKIANQYTEKLNNVELKAKFVDGGQIDINMPYIKVITMEASKGLEFPFVAVAGLKRGIFPDIPTKLEDDEKKVDIAKQKRLFYVACSRAIQNLAVFTSLNEPSSFVNDLSQVYWIKEGEDI